MILDFTAKKIADTIDSFNNPNKALFIYGHTGKGKTYSALKYCAENKNCLYFSFRNLDSEFALRVFSNAYLEIFTPASDWSDFFKQLACYSKKNRLSLISTLLPLLSPTLYTAPAALAISINRLRPIL